MSQSLDRLVYMANQIAREFENQRPHEAVDATWDHLWHFWDPRMCAHIIAHLAAGGAGLTDTARRAVELLRDTGEAPSQTPATRFGVSAEGGARSDAG